MARKKPLNQYPLEYSYLIEKGCQYDIKIPCDSNAQAMNLRNDLYAFRQVLYDVSERDIGLIKLSNSAQNCRFLVTDATLTVEPIRRPKWVEKRTDPKT